MTYIIEVLRQEHRNIESLLCVLERELSVFDRGDRPDYEVVLAVLDYFKDYPDCCHHPKEDMIVEKLKARDPVATATIADLAGEHQEGTRRLRRVAQAVERVLSDQDLVRQNVDKSFATSSTTNGSTWPWRSASCFRPRSTRCGQRTGQILL